MKKSIFYQVISNTDLNEGRGSEVVLYTCEAKVTAVKLGKKRYIQGSDCPIREIELYYIDGWWRKVSFPISITLFSEEDYV